MDEPECIFKVEDYRGKVVIFTKAKWEEKRLRHPELNKAAFLKRVERAIVEPDEVWEDYEDRNRKRCYYKKYSSVSYAKVVVFIMETKFNKKKILDFVANFAKIAKEKKWISDYDADDDSIAIRVPQLSMESRKRYINDEFAFYLNAKGEVEGIFVEYFLSNFVEHHRDFKKATAGLKKKDEGLIKLTKNEMKKLVPEFQEVIIESILPGRDLQKVAP
jgi:hypothetical protein